MEFPVGKVSERRNRPFHIERQLNAAIGTRSAAFNVRALAASAFVELGDFIRERLQLLSVTGQIKAWLDPMLLPVLAVCLGLERQLKFHVAENLIAITKNP